MSAAPVERVKFLTWHDTGRGLNHVTALVNNVDVGKLTMDDRQLFAFSTLFAPAQNGRTDSADTHDGRSVPDQNGSSEAPR